METETQSWGDQLRRYRQDAGLTQGQFITELSLLVGSIDDEDRASLDEIGIFGEVATYFAGMLDAPTLSRLEQGKRTVNARPRCLGFIWALNSLGVLDGIHEANAFVELAGHGNLTDSESVALFGEGVLHLTVEAVPESGLDDKPVADAAPREAAEPSVEKPALETPTANIASESSQHRPRLLAAAAAVAIVVVAVALFAVSGSGSESATPQIHVLLADEIASVTGSVGNDQTVSSLHEQDQQGSSNEWLQFVKLIPEGDTYSGFRAYSVPSFIPVDAITGISLDVNYRGPDFAAAPWVWEIERVGSDEQVRLGDNAESLWWDEWTAASFDFPVAEGEEFDASTFVEDGQIWISLSITSEFADETLDMDYEALVIEWAGSDA